MSLLTVKRATLGGRGNEFEFERSLANLAHAYLQDKSPLLMRYMVGFQLLDKSEDDTRAFGVAIFRAGKRTLMVPIFFINGRLKGHEVLYLPDQNRKVPLNDRWVRHILDKQSTSMGKTVSRDFHRVMGREPNLWSLSNARYGLKSAGAFLASKFYRARLPDIDLERFLDKSAYARDHARYLTANMRAYPEYAEVLLEYHPDLAGTLKRAAARPHPGREGVLDRLGKRRPALRHQPSILPDHRKEALRLTIRKVTIIGTSYPNPESVLDEDGLRELAETGIAILDRRRPEEKSEAYPVTGPDDFKFSNPTETGIYDVLTASGRFKKCLVVLNPVKSWGHQRSCEIIDLESRARDSAHPSLVFVKDTVTEEGSPEERYRKWLETLPRADEADLEGTFIVLDRRGDAAGPLNSFYQGSHDGDLGRIVEVDSILEYYPNERSRPIGEFEDPDADKRRRQRAEEFYRQRALLHVRKVEGAKIRSSGNQIFVPADARVFRLDRASGDRLLLGNPIDIYRSMATKTAALSVDWDGCFWKIAGRPMNEVEARVYLVRDVGLAKEAADEILDTARRRGSGSWRVLDKQGRYYDLQTSGQAAPSPSLPEPSQEIFGIPAYVNDREGNYADARSQVGVGEVIPSNFRESDGELPPPDPTAVQMAMQAASTGKKEIVDASVLASLIRRRPEESIISDHLHDLDRAMDSIFDLLLNLYWKSDEFAERYGKADLVDLENNLRSAAETLGDLVLDLKEKDIQSTHQDINDFAEGEED